MSMQTQRVNIRFKRPSGACINEPSVTFREALILLGECEELQPLHREAEKTGKTVSIEMFQSRDGNPILIHFGKEDG
jgi:hypothetical protein